MGKAIISGGAVMTAPVGGTLLSSLAVGSIVKLNESGSPVEFYVAKHDYESGLNGSGRTLLVRKDCYGSRKWHTSNSNYYASSDIDTWLNGDYVALLDADIKTAINKTKFYYTERGTASTITTLSRIIFLLSVTELGYTSTLANVEGVSLPIASNLQIAYCDGSARAQWTRTPTVDETAYVCISNDGGGVYKRSCTSSGYVRPCFTLPATALVQAEDGTIKL